MTRNLLPRFQEDASVPRADVGEWMRLANPSSLTELDFGDEEQDLRVRIQSIPSPWARMILFKNALENDSHPARRMVQSELLDGLEFIWYSGMTGLDLKVERLDLGELVRISRRTGSKSAVGFAEAAYDMLPTDIDDRILYIIKVKNRPIIASSPYTMFFTSEDAGSVIGTHFQFSHGSPYRSLGDRPPSFQKYIARVIHPQISRGVSSESIRRNLGRLIKSWLEDEIERSGEQIQNGINWNAAAEDLGLESVVTFAGVELFRSQSDSAILDSPWLLRPTIEDAIRPIVISPKYFDGFFFRGSAKVSLPPLDDQPRDILPNSGQRYPWVCPETDWLADRILLFQQPLQNVLGFRKYTWTGDPSNPLAKPRMTLPLLPRFFRFFRPTDVDNMLTVKVAQNGTIDVTLTLKVGAEGEGKEIVIRKTYTESDIDRGPGAEIAIWPSFVAPGWQDYVLVRMDLTEALAERYEITGFERGEELAISNTARREPLLRTFSFKACPEVLHISNATAAGTGSLGIVLPEFSLSDVTDTGWHVGIDFGTSNTVVSERSEGILDLSGLVLILSELAEGREHLMHAYFFPERIPPDPFGTLLVHLASMGDFRIKSSEEFELRANIPFTRYVDSRDTNKIVGDLKWSHDQKMAFMSFSFLKLLILTVLGAAAKQGIKPSNMTFSWSYPRAFTSTQRNTMRRLWQQVMDSFGYLGLKAGAITEPYDESVCVFNYFFRKQGGSDAISKSGATNVILDIGGGTTDIAAYGRGAVQILDSVTFAGRHLTGTGEQLFSGDETNRFVRSLAAFARGNGLSQFEDEALVKYLNDRQDHLAFAYLMSSGWERGAEFLRFQNSPESAHFKVLVLYFYSALFYYIGLSLRSREVERASEVPHKVILAGNGSRYFDWLSDFSEEIPSQFSAVLENILLEGMNTEANGPLRISRSSDPKKEVALGILDIVIRDEGEDRVGAGNVVGESIDASVGEAGTRISYNPTDRWIAENQVLPQHVASLDWRSAMPGELERFHRRFQREVLSLGGYGEPWNRAPRWLESGFSKVNTRDLQQEVKRRIAVLSNAEEGFRRSIFLLEASIVMQGMLEEFFPKSAL